MYLNEIGKQANVFIQEMDIMNANTTWVYTFNWEKDLDSVGFKLKDYVNWTTYKIIVNTDTVVNYTGPVPDGGDGGWYSIYYKF